MMDIGTIFFLALPAIDGIQISWMSNNARLGFLLATFAVVFGFELALPLFNRRRGDMVGHATRNMALTAVFPMPQRRYRAAISDADTDQIMDESWTLCP